MKPRYGKPQYLGSSGFQRERPIGSGFAKKSSLPPIPRPEAGYKTLSKEAAQQIADALRMMLR